MSTFAASSTILLLLLPSTPVSRSQTLGDGINHTGSSLFDRVDLGGARLLFHLALHHRPFSHDAKSRMATRSNGLQPMRYLHDGLIPPVHGYVNQPDPLPNPRTLNTSTRIHHVADQRTLRLSQQSLGRPLNACATPASRATHPSTETAS